MIKELFYDNIYLGGRMNFTNNENSMKDLGKLVLITAGMGLLGIYFLGILLFFYPMLFLESSVKNGIGKTMGAMALSALLIGLFTNIMAGVSLFFTFAPMVLIFHYGIFNNKSYKVVVVLMIIVLALSVISLQLGLTPLGSFDIDEIIDSIVHLEIEGLEEELSNLELSRLQDNLRYVLEFSISILPGIFLILIGLMAYINYVFAARRLLRQGILINQPPIFPMFQVPRVSILIFGLFIGLSFLLRQGGIEYYKEVYLNTLVIFGFLYFLNGFALVNFLLLRTRLGTFGRVIIYMIIIFFVPVTLLVTFAGLIDALLNFRKARVKKE